MLMGYFRIFTRFAFILLSQHQLRDAYFRERFATAAGNETGSKENTFQWHRRSKMHAATLRSITQMHQLMRMDTRSL